MWSSKLRQPRSCRINIDSTVLVSGEQVLKKAVFSANGTLLYAKGLKPSEIPDPAVLIGQSFEQIEAEFGPYHYDCGSGMFYPSYITKSGYMIVLYLSDEVTVDGIIYIDLRTGEEQQITDSEQGDAKISTID